MGVERMHIVDGMRAWCARVEVWKLKEIITDSSHEPFQEHGEVRKHVQPEGYVRGQGAYLLCIIILPVSVSRSHFRSRPSREGAIGLGIGLDLKPGADGRRDADLHVRA